MKATKLFKLTRDFVVLYVIFVAMDELSKNGLTFDQWSIENARLIYNGSLTGIISLIFLYKYGGK